MTQTGNARQLDQDDLLEIEDESRSGVAYAFLLCGLASALTTVCIRFALDVLHHVIDAFAVPEMDLASLCVWLVEFLWPTHS
ncbi:ABC Superfamily [Phytophthora cinnamomi]|nr:ABC Superfamily [Phytophthora cinnamomi]